MVHIMLNLRPPIYACFLATCMSVAYAKTVQPLPSCSIAVTTGNLSNVTVNSSTNAKQVLQDTRRSCEPTKLTGTSKAMSVYERDLHRLLLANNPTIVTVTGARLMTWLEDGGRQTLNVNIENKSNFPVPSVKLQLLQKFSGQGFFPTDLIELERPGLYKALGSDRISLSAKQSIAIPVGFVDEIRRRYITNVSDNFCVFDAGIGLSDEDEHRNFAQLRTPGSVHVHVISLTLGADLLTIFEQKLQINSWVNLRFADRNTTGQVWYSSTKSFEDLKCLD